MNLTETFQKNLDALSEVDAEAHRWLSTSGPDPNIRAEKNLYVVQPDGKPYAYYPSDPSISSEIRNIDSMDLASGTLTCLIGMGLGYTAKAILETMEQGHLLMVVEPNAHIMRLALERFDFSHALLTNALFILLPDREAIQSRIYHLIDGGYLYKDLSIKPDPRSISLFPDYNNWISNVQRAFGQATTLLSGEIKAAKFCVLNELENLIHVTFSPGIERIKHIYAGRPILIIGAGPSLEKSIEWIYRLRHKAILMAYAGSWRTLLAHGIIPHLLAASDKNIESVGMLKNTTHAHECPLIYSSRVHPKFLKNYTGPCFAVPDAGPVGVWLSPFLGKTVKLPAGMNVANFALHLADYFESNPVIITGMDLAFGEYTHAEGHPQRSKVKDNSTFISIEGVGGSVVKTTAIWCAIREGIEEQIRTMSKPVINATVSGAKIQYTKESTLEELSKTVLEMKPFVGFETSVSPVTFEDYGQPLSEELTAFLNEADKCLIACKNGMEASKRYKRSFGKSEPFKEELRQTINRHTSSVEQLMERYPFLKLYLGDILLQAKVANARIALQVDEKARFKIEVEKNQQALAAFEKDLGKLIDVIGSKVRDLKDFHDILDDPGDGRSEFTALKLAPFLFQNHLYEEAYSEARRALSIRADFPEALLFLVKISTEKRRFTEARRWIEKSMVGQGKSGESEKCKKLRSVIEMKIQELHKEKEEAIHRSDLIDERLLSKELDL